MKIKVETMLKDFFTCDKNGQQVFPFFSEVLNLFILILAIINFTEWTFQDKPLITLETAITWGLTLSNGISSTAPKIFTYHVVVYALAHLIYSTLIIQYYLVRGECLLGLKLVILVYFANAIIVPILTFFFIKAFALWFHANWALFSVNIWSQNYYVGPSIAIWGVAGFVMPKEGKNILYWAGFVLIIGLAIILKIFGLRHTDWTADVAHLIAFFGSAVFGYLTKFKWYNEDVKIKLKFLSFFTLMVVIMAGLLVYFIFLL